MQQFRSFALVAILMSFCASVCSAQAVFAHFMAQNAYSYSQSDWENDFSVAKSIGIDGFALNIVAVDYEVDRIADAYKAAESSGFQLFYSFDMNYQWSKEDIVKIVSTHASSTSSYRYNDALLVSTFNGASSGDDFWASVKSSLLSQGITVSFAPAFIDTPASSLVSEFPSVDGFLNWWSWPGDVNANLTTEADLGYKEAISSKSGPYIMAVSPWQFKNLADDQDWVLLSDTLWHYRWLDAINEVKPDIIEIISWNDYPESHYIADINPNVYLGDLATQYVTGFDHSAWRTPAAHFISWYKNGSEPSIDTDRVVYWYRVFPNDISCSSGSPPRNADFPRDAVFAFAMLSSPATVSLDIGSNHYEWNAEAGISLGSVDFPSEDKAIPTVKISRNGATIKSGTGPQSVNKTECAYYNFNPVVASLE